ncbi:glycosyltransferase family 4 protein [Desulfoplanes sp. PS50]
MSQVVVNTRILSGHITGVQRYLYDILDVLPRDARIDSISPEKPMHGIAGHFWEQFVLPSPVRGKVLWSPSNTGPLAVSKQVVTIHDVVPLDHPEWLNTRFGAWYRFLLPKLVQRVERVIAISVFTKYRLLERTNISADKIEVIYNGVSPRFSPQSSESIAEMVQSLKIPSKNYILSLGSLEPRKNLGRLLQAWNFIQSKVPDDIWLVVSGAKGKNLVFQDVPELKKLPSRVYLTGHVPDTLLPQLYAGALAFAYLSVYEGFGLPPLEAMASGTPTLVGNRSSLPEVVGDAAIQVDPYDAEAIAESLKLLIEDSELRNVLRKTSIKQAKKFSWKNTAKQTLQILNKVI